MKIRSISNYGYRSALNSQKITIFIFTMKGGRYMDTTIYDKLNAFANLTSIPTLKYPIFVSNENRIRIGAIAFDPEVLVWTSDGGYFNNLYEAYVQNIEPEVTKLHHQLRDTKKRRHGRNKNKAYLVKQLEDEKICRNTHKFHIFDEFIRRLWDQYDIIVTEGMESLQNAAGNHSFRGDLYPGKIILSKPYFQEFLIALNFYIGYSRISKALIQADLDISIKAHNTCSNCGTIFGMVAINKVYQWQCPYCRVWNHEAWNTARNLRQIYFDQIMKENKLTALYGK